VRKVQVSTHFDDLNITANGSSTPEPPGPTNLDDAIIKVVENDYSINDNNGINVPETRAAVYATKFPSPPQELNTLVPEDFNLIDFNFIDRNHKKKDEVIITDHHFIVEEQKEMPKTEKSKETKSEQKESTVEEIKAARVEKVEPVSTPTAAAAATATATASVATAAVLSTIEEERNERSEPVKSPRKDPVPLEAEVDKEPLKKVSDSRKSLEPSQTLTVTEVKPAPIIVSQVSKSGVSKTAAESKTVAETPKDSGPKQSPEPELKGTPIVIAVQKDEMKKVEKEPKVITKDIEEITAAPPPLPTNNAHLLASRDSLKPSLLPVMPVNGAPSADLEASKPQFASSPLATSTITADELECLRKELNDQKLVLEREIDNKKALESQIQAMISKSNAQDEALKYKNESLEQLHSDYLKTNNDLTSARNEKEKLGKALAKAEEELAVISETNARAYLEKSEEVTALKDKLAEFAAIIGQKNKEIDSLQRQLDEVKRLNLNTALENVQQYEKIEDELMKMVEEEILRMQDTIDEQREYNAQLQIEVDAEYTYWKRRLELKAEAEKHKATE
jgi:hypothetical protein